MQALTPFLDDLIQVTDRAQAWRVASSFFESFGLDRLVYLDAAHGRAPVLTTFPRAWQTHYRTMQYEQVDPFAGYCCATMETISTGAAYLDDHAYLSKAESQLIDEASQYGAVAGFSVTARPLAFGPPAGWNLCSGQSRRDMETLRKHQEPVLRLAALYAHERLQALSRATPQSAASAGLSRREIQCLSHIAAGLRVKQVAVSLDLAPVTVELHLRNARSKLGVQTRDEAVVRALVLGLIATNGG